MRSSSKFTYFLLKMNRIREELFYKELRNSERPQYPFPGGINPHIEKLFQEYCQWIDVDGGFESLQAGEKHKRHRLTDIAARAFPSMTLDELRPVARFTAFLAIVDDYMDRTGYKELMEVSNKIAALCTGEDDIEPEAGFYHQMYQMREEALACGMPLQRYQEYVNSILDLMTGYAAEKKFNAAGVPPPLETYKAIRRQTSGGVCYAKYLCMGKRYHHLPDSVLSRPDILRLQDICGDLIGYHNDFISLPKELARDGDVINLVITLMQERSLGLRAAYQKALEVHDETLAEFIRIQSNLPDFGAEWKQLAQEYVNDLGIMIQGVYKWHTHASGRYVPGAYVEPEHQPAVKGSHITVADAKEATASGNAIAHKTTAWGRAGFTDKPYEVYGRLVFFVFIGITGLVAQIS